MTLTEAQEALKGPESFTVVASTVHVKWSSPLHPKIDQKSCMRTNMKDTTQVTKAFNAIFSVQPACFAGFVQHISKTARIYNEFEAAGSKWGVVTWEASKTLLEKDFGNVNFLLIEYT
jgi:hypothetical protein